MSEKEAIRSETPPTAVQEHGKDGSGSESTAVPMPAKEEGAPAEKGKPEREPSPKDLLVGSSRSPMVICCMAESG